jgi:hypothetical protein
VHMINERKSKDIEFVFIQDMKFTLICPPEQEQTGMRKLQNKGATFTKFTFDTLKEIATTINTVVVCNKSGRGEKEREGRERMLI